jgi:hypothetical protein
LGKLSVLAEAVLSTLRVAAVYPPLSTRRAQRVLAAGAQRVPVISGSVAAPQRTLYPMFTRTWSPWKRKLAVIV